MATELRTFREPQSVRRLFARSRAAVLGVEVAPLVAGRVYETRSQSNPAEHYRLTRTRAGWVCGCRGYAFTGCCKHLGELENRASAEGWHFGEVAPLDA